MKGDGRSDGMVIAPTPLHEARGAAKPGVIEAVRRSSTCRLTQRVLPQDAS